VGVEGGGILFHLTGRTKSRNDPFDRTGMPTSTEEKGLAAIGMVLIQHAANSDTMTSRDG
jgi:hypothetical protein